MSKPKSRGKVRTHAGVSRVWVIGAAYAIATGCAGAERDFGATGVSDAGQASTVRADAGVVEVPSSSTDAGDTITLPAVGSVSDAGEPVPTNDTEGGNSSLDAAASEATSSEDDSSGGVTSEPPGGDTSGTEPGTAGYSEDEGHASSCVALCKGSFYGDLALSSSKVTGLRIVVPQSQCPTECASEVVEIAAGSEHTCARRGDGTVKCWGNGFQGRLGLGDVLWHGSGPGEMGEALPAVDLGDHVARSVVAGHDHTCALLDDGHVSCWGGNSEGQLGLGDANDRGDEVGEMGNSLPHVDLGSGRTAVAISAGHRYTCAVLDGGDVKCWGQDELGKLGQGNSGSLGDADGEMGDALPVVNLGTDVRAVTVEATYQHTCALLDSGSIKCWGYENAGRLGRQGNDATGDDLAEMGNSLPLVNLGERRFAASLGLGYLHSCAVMSDNHALKCWGYGQGGRLGLGDGMSRGDGDDQMGDSLLEVELGTDATVRSVAPSDEHTCALLGDGSIKCWGIATLGRLGSGGESNLGDEPREMGDQLARVDLGTGRFARALTSGQRHTCALLDEGSVKCWGEADAGRLGLGDQNDRGDEPGEMGDALPAVALW